MNNTLKVNEQYIKEVLKRVVDQEDNRAQAAEEVMTKVNLGSVQEPKETQVGSFFADAKKEALISLLREYVDVFDWSYQDMPGLDPSIVEHRIPLDPESKPVKQKLRKIKPEWL